MATRITTKTIRVMISAHVAGRGLDLAALGGSVDTTEAKISSDMPLPMPRWVMSLAHPHEQRRAGGEREHDERHVADVVVGHQVEAGVLPPRKPAATVVEQVGEAGRLHDGDADGDVAGPLGDLALADGALVLPLLELGDHHAEDLHDDRRRDVRHDPEREDGELGERAAGEQLQEGEDAALLGLLLAGS